MEVLKRGYCNEFLELTPIGSTKVYLAATLMPRDIAEKELGWCESLGDVFIYVLEGALTIEYKEPRPDQIIIAKNEVVLMPRGSQYLIYSDEMTIYIAVVDETHI